MSRAHGKIFVTGPDGSPLSVANLPPLGCNRWSAHRKAIVVAAVRGGLLSIDEARERYRLSIEEFLTWAERYDGRGVTGLLAKRCGKHEPPSSP